MKKGAIAYLIFITTFLFSYSCVNKTTLEEGDWQGCIIGMYPENGNVTLPSGDEQELHWQSL